MSANAVLSEKLQEMAQFMELLGAEPFRANAFSRAARAVAELPEDVEVLAEDPGALRKVEGLGPKLADRVLEFCRTGHIAEHGVLRSQLPPGLPALLRIPGLGPKTVRTLWQEGGITDTDGLRRAIADGTLAKLPRMGTKSVEKLRSNLAFVTSVEPRLWLGRAYALADAFLEHLRADPAVARAAVVGSVRRGRDTAGNIDLLVAIHPDRSGAHASVVGRFNATPGVTEVLPSTARSDAVSDETYSVRVSLAPDLARWKPKEGASEEIKGPGVRVDLRIVPLDRWGESLVRYTGSASHVEALSGRGRAARVDIFEGGRTMAGVGDVPSSSDEDAEAAVFRRLDLALIPPEARESSGELERTGAWDLVALSDIKSELHAHTTASDGSLSILELAQEARRRGFHTIAVTDHSQSSSIAGGLRPDRLRRHIDDVRRANEEVPGITILAGSEVDILADGSLDYSDELLALLDIVVASPHAGLTQDSVAATARTLRALRHPLVHVMGHPTGRLVNRRRGLEPAFAEIAAAAAEHNTALEVNSHWMRLDLRDIHVRQAVDAGCLIAVNTDAHTRQDFDNLRFGVMTARRGWCPRDRCINTWNAPDLRKWLKSKR